MKNFHKLIVILVLLGLPFMAEAQFYSVGDDPGRLKWYSIESRNYRIIYPGGLDSLARVYGEMLEQYRLPVGASAGYFPGEMTRKKMPVILHACNAQSNGSVAWAPKRMDLFTSPQGYGAEAMPWEKMLAIHESRHVSQMQFGLSNAFRPFYWIFGEMFAGAMPGIYPSKWMLEGDAVVAETALTDAGRGRSADFLNYYMAAFDNGDFRNWNRWRYGSFKYFTPDHYSLGYMTISGIRYSSGKAGFMGEYLTHVSRRPYDIFSYSTISKRYTGKNFRRAFDATMHLYHDIWSEEKSFRAPFLKAEQISRPRKEYTEYSDIFVAGDTVYALKESMGRAKSLVMRLPSGKEKVLSSFGVTSGPLWHSPETGKVWWSEYISDERWSQEIHSVIRYCDLKTGKNIEGDLNPSSDTPTHLELYRAFPEIGGIVHTHSTYATAWAQAGKDIPNIGTTHADYFHDAIPCTADMTAGQMAEYEKETGTVIVERFKDINYIHTPGVLVKNHGPFSWGKDPDNAVYNAVVMEQVAKMAFVSFCVNPATTMNQLLVEKHFSRKHGPNAYYGQKKK